MKKRGESRDQASRQRMQALDDPTAAFPIGTLGQIASELEDRSDEDRPEVHDEDPDTSADAAPSPRTVRVGYLVLSLVGGTLAAFVIGIGIVFVALVLQQR